MGVDRYAVVGNPVAHSKSPMIHSLFAQQTGESIEYVAQQVDEGEFEKEATAFFQGGGKGLNVTVPYKIEAHELAGRLTERARRAGAVNTLFMEDGTLVGDNTDGAGLYRDLEYNLGVKLVGKRILVLGAGGAVRGILTNLLAAKPESVVIANRTVKKAERLAQAFSRLGNLSACGFEQLAGQQFDLVINGTSASLAGDLPPLPENILASGACCYDMMYGSSPTVFMQWAEQAGAATIADGLGMLVEQAAESFRIWRGPSPETPPVIAAVRNSL